jgi:hypothetical protein
MNISEENNIIYRIYYFITIKIILSIFILGVCATLEQLPNELFFYLFTFMDIHDLYSAFWGLNSRLNNLLQSCQNLCLIFDETNDLLLMKSYAPYVTRLTIDTSIIYDFSRFANLHKLTLCNENAKHLKLIQPYIIPKVTHLSFLLGSRFTTPLQIVHNVFSNKFPSLRHVNLGRINEFSIDSWSISPSLQFVSIRSNKPMIVSAILTVCPNLYHLRLHVLDNDPTNVVSSAPHNHPLQRFTLWSDEIELTFDYINAILTYTPNIQHLYLQTIVRTPFIHLAHGFLSRLNRLSRFDCYVKEIMNYYNRNGNLAGIHQLHCCFNRIRCIEEKAIYRIFATD